MSCECAVPLLVGLYTLRSKIVQQFVVIELNGLAIMGTSYNGDYITANESLILSVARFSVNGPESKVNQLHTKRLADWIWERRRRNRNSSE